MCKYEFTLAHGSYILSSTLSFKFGRSDHHRKNGPKNRKLVSIACRPSYCGVFLAFSNGEIFHIHKKKVFLFGMAATPLIVNGTVNLHQLQFSPEGDVLLIVFEDKIKLLHFNSTTGNKAPYLDMEYSIMVSSLLV